LTALVPTFTLNKGKEENKELFSYRILSLFSGSFCPFLLSIDARWLPFFSCCLCVFLTI